MSLRGRESVSSCEALLSSRGTGVLSPNSILKQKHSREASGEFSRKSSKGKIENLKQQPNTKESSGQAKEKSGSFRRSKRSLSRTSLEQPLKPSLKNRKVSIDKTSRTANDDINQMLQRKQSRRVLEEEVEEEEEEFASGKEQSPAFGRSRHCSP